MTMRFLSISNIVFWYARKCVLWINFSPSKREMIYCYECYDRYDTSSHVEIVCVGYLYLFFSHVVSACPSLLERINSFVMFLFCMSKINVVDFYSEIKDWNALVRPLTSSSHTNCERLHFKCDFLKLSNIIFSKFQIPNFFSLNGKHFVCMLFSS